MTVNLYDGARKAVRQLSGKLKTDDPSEEAQLMVDAGAAMAEIIIDIAESLDGIESMMPGGD